MEKGQAYIVAGTDPEPETSDADDDGVAETVSPMLKLPDVANTSLMLLKNGILVMMIISKVFLNKLTLC